MSLVGNLEDLGLGDILQIVSLSRKSGVLSLVSRGREGKVVFRDGQVIRATSSAYRENLGDLLLSKGVVDLGVLKSALAAQKKRVPPPRLGTILSEDFGIAQEVIEGIVKGQVEKIVYSFFAWTEGTFSFALGEPGELADTSFNPLQFMLDQGLNPQWLAMEGSRLLDERRHRGEPLEEEVPEPAAELLEPLPEEEAPAVPHTYDWGAELLREMGVEGAARGKGPESPGLHLLKGMLQELNNPSLGGGIILLVLRFASELMNRAVIFLAKDKEIVGLGQFGIDLAGEMADVRVRRMKIPRNEESIFSAVLEDKIAHRVRMGSGRWDAYLREQLGGSEPEEIFLGPLVSEGQVVAVLYGDNLPERTPIGDTESLEIFLSQAGMAMEKALLERRLRGKLAI